MYPCDLDNRKWQMIQSYFSKFFPKPGCGRPRKYSLRHLFNGVLYVLRSGCAWRLVPKDYPHWKSVYRYFRIWNAQGLIRKICRCLVRRTRRMMGKRMQPMAACIDSQSVRSAPHAGKRGLDGNKQTNGIKRHILVDSNGLLLDVVVHEANIFDGKGGRRVMEKAYKGFWRRLLLVWADSAYRGSFSRWVEEEYGFEVEVKAKPKGKGFIVLPRRWVVERTFAWLGRYRRLSKNYEVRFDVAEGMIQLAAINLMLNRLTK